MCDVSCRKARQYYKITKKYVALYFNLKDMTVSQVSGKTVVVSKGSLKYFLLCNSSVLSRFVILYSLKGSNVFSPPVEV